jgi:hypothetical protein
MTWLTPLAGVLLAAAVIPPLIILYFLKLRRKPQPISSTFLWQQAVEDIRANAPFQRLRKSLLLILQLLALILLALSIMQPQLQAGTNEGGKTVLLIDNSASMNSTSVSPDQKQGDATRLDEAKRRAKQRIEELYSGGMFTGGGGETMIIAFSDKAEIYSRFTSSKQQLLAAIDRIEPSDGETRIAEALKLARAYTTNPNPDLPQPIADPATLELFSDGRIADMTDQVLRGETLKFHSIGAEQADNVAFASISVERPYDRPSAVQVFASLLNFNTEQITARIQLSIDGVARGIEETTIPPAEINPSTQEFIAGRANVVFTPFDQPRGAVIELANLREDDLKDDNIVNVVVAPPKQLVVALVIDNPDRSAVKRALEGMQFERLEILSPARFEQKATAGELEPYDVVVIDSYEPQAMPPGRYLSFGPTPPVQGLSDFGEGEQQIVLSAKDDHPAMRFVTYDSIVISKFRLIQPASDVQVVMEGSRGPVMLAISRGAMQVIHCPFDPLESNWPFQRGFVTFLVNAVDYLGHSGQAITNEALRPGEAITARLPASASDVKLIAPGESTAYTLSAQDPTQLAWGPIRLAGLHTLTWKNSSGDDATQSRMFAVNLTSETEGRVELNPIVQIGQERIDARDTGDSAYTPLWPYAIGLCLLVLMIEWWVYHRKAYI